MNWRHGLVGAAVIAAGIGLYTYMTDDSRREETEATGFREEGIAPTVELPDNEGIVSYESPEAEIKKNPIRTKPEIQEYNKKEETRRKRPYYPLVPKSFGLEDALEEEEERPTYDLHQEERDKLTVEELAKYYSKALRAENYKVAETYLSDFQKHTDPEDKFGMCNLAHHYNEYLSRLIQDCKKQDYESVFSKILWGNRFLADYNEAILLDSCETIVSSIDSEVDPLHTEGVSDIKRLDGHLRYTLKLDPITLIQKGDQALEAVEYCQNE